MQTARARTRARADARARVNIRVCNIRAHILSGVLGHNGCAACQTG